ncbi:PHD-finger and DNA binding domain-containing protein [Tasmannia lanceolata]|uniref:PHD-finger and DNA binding domain-containing protein n=1 Tax=Tasmannia lanceolata TaxID=3420 RepID=UPI0040643A3C
MEELLGRVVKKSFEGFGVFSGVVQSYDPDSGFFKIVYEDGDSEEMESHEVGSILQKKRGRKAKKRGQLGLGMEVSNSTSSFIDVQMRDSGLGEGLEETLERDGSFNGGFCETLEREVRVGGNLVGCGSVDPDLKGDSLSVGAVEESHVVGFSTDAQMRERGLGEGFEETLERGGSFNGGFSETLEREVGVGGNLEECGSVDQDLKGNYVSVGSVEESHMNDCFVGEGGLKENAFCRPFEGTQMKDFGFGGDCNGSDSGFDGNLKEMTSNGDVEETRMDGTVFGGDLKPNVSPNNAEETQMKDFGFGEGSKGSDSGGDVDENSKEMPSYGDHGETCLDGSVFGEDLKANASPKNAKETLEKTNGFGGDLNENASLVALEDNQMKASGFAEFQLKEGRYDGGSPIKHGHCHRKRRKLESTPVVALRRSARRATADVTSSPNHILVMEKHSAVDAVLIGECFGMGGEESKELSSLSSKLALPPPSNDPNVDEIPVLDLFSVYACLRSFSTLLFLSPFTLEAFVEALKCKFASPLLDSIHFCILQALKLHLEFHSGDGFQPASDCLRNLNWDFLDLITWPVYLVEYLLVHGFVFKSGFKLLRLKLLNGEYYKQSAMVKLEILQRLCDDVIEAEAIRLELDRRTRASELEMDTDQITNVESYSKIKDSLEDLGGSCLTQEGVDKVADLNSDECCLCKMEGSLICCDGCPAAYHSRCVGMVKDLLPEGDWFCLECVIAKRDGWKKSLDNLRGAELLGIDPDGRLYFGCYGYLLVSDSCGSGTESFCYYKKNDLYAVIKFLQSSDISYSDIISAISMHWDIPVLPIGEKSHIDLDTQTVSTDLDMDNEIRAAHLSSSFLPVSMKNGIKGEPIDETKPIENSSINGEPVDETKPIENSSINGEPIDETKPIENSSIKGEPIDETKPSENSFISVDDGHQRCNISESETICQSIEMASTFASSGDSAATMFIQNSHKAGTDCSMKSDSSLELKIQPKINSFNEEFVQEPTDLDIVERNQRGFKVPEPTLFPTKLRKEVASQTLFELGYYVNYYSFGQMAHSVAEELVRKSSEKVKDSKISEEEIISAQLKAISKKSMKFCWSSIQRLNVDAQKENCGWCFSCKTSSDRGCLFNVVDKSVPDCSKIRAVGLRSKRNRKSHLSFVIYHILSIEECLHGLLSGPWENPHHSKQWRKSVLKASDVSSVKPLLLILESNIRRIALSAEWMKQVDSAVMVGSASHVLTTSTHVSSKHGSGKKLARKNNSDAGSNFVSHANTTSGIHWWRGGRLSRQVFRWKVLPQSLASMGGRQAGCRKIPGILYPDGSEFAKRSKYIAWRALVEMSTSVAQLACQVRDLYSNIRWDDLANTQLFPQLAKESKKLARSLKKVTIRRKCVEGTQVNYLLDFGKRKSIPHTVTRHGVMLEEPLNERKKYWLNESYVPLHLLKAYEEKKLARTASKSNSGLLYEGGKRKKPSRQKGLSHILSRAEKFETYQCGHCNKDVLIREAVNCQFCEGFFHKRHARASKGTSTSKGTYACHRCQMEKVRSGKSKISTDGRPQRLLKKASSVSFSVKRKKLDGCKNSSLMKVTKRKKLDGCKSSVLVKRKRVDGRKSSVSVKRKKVDGCKTSFSVNCKKFDGSKRGSQFQSKSGTFKKSKNDIRWKRSHRTPVFHAYWLNGLLWTRKPYDERGVHFRERKVILPFKHKKRMLIQPICCICYEGYDSGSLYVGCESCEDWFHGDAYGLTVENINNLLGFKCHNCLKRSSPSCQHSQDAELNEVQLHKEKNNKAETECDLSGDKMLPSEIDERASPTKEDCHELCHTDEPEHEEQRIDVSPDSKDAEVNEVQLHQTKNNGGETECDPCGDNKLLSETCERQRSPPKDDCLGLLHSDEPVHNKQRIDAIPEAIQILMLEQHIDKSEKQSIIVGSLELAEPKCCRSDEDDRIQSGATSLQHKTEDCLKEMSTIPELLDVQATGDPTELHAQNVVQLDTKKTNGTATMCVISDDNKLPSKTCERLSLPSNEDSLGLFNTDEKEKEDAIADSNQSYDELA